MPEGFAGDRNIQSKVANYLGYFDESIHGFEVGLIENSDIKDEYGRKKYAIKSVHKMVNSDESEILPLGRNLVGL